MGLPGDQLVDDQAEGAEGAVDGGGLLQLLPLRLRGLLPLTACTQGNCSLRRSSSGAFKLQKMPPFTMLRMDVGG